MNILGIIPAREGSKSIPKKNIKPLAGKPLLAYTAKAAHKSARLTRLIISTESPEITGIARQLHIDIPFMRPAELARDDTPMTAVIRHALEALKEKEDYLPAILVILQPTSPLRTAGDIDRCIEKLIEAKADSVVSVCDVPSHYHPCWQLLIQEEKLARFNGEPLAHIAMRRQDLSATYYRNGAVYALWTDTVLIKGSLYGDQCLPYIMPQERSLNIDSPENWAFAEYCIKTKRYEPRSSDS